MTHTLQILAESDPIAKFIGVGAVALIWIIGLIAQAIKKQSETRQQGKPRPIDLAEAIKQRLPKEMSRPQKQPQPRQPKRPPPMKQQKKQPQGRPNWQQIAAPPPVPQTPAPPPVAYSTTKVEAPAPRAGARSIEEPAVKKPPFVGAQALNRWLTPATLQQQFILTELMQKPKCMRDDDR